MTDGRQWPRSWRCEINWIWWKLCSGHRKPFWLDICFHHTVDRSVFCSRSEDPSHQQRHGHNRMLYNVTVCMCTAHIRIRNEPSQTSPMACSYKDMQTLQYTMCSQVVWHVNVEGMVMYDVHLRPAIPFKPNIKTVELLGSLLNPFKVFSTSTLTKLEIQLQ